MTYDEFKRKFEQVYNQFEGTSGLKWLAPLLRPEYFMGDLIGWSLTAVGTFNDGNFLRVRENWKTLGTDFERKFFSYHYGPYEQQWDLYKVKAQKVVVRIDGVQEFTGSGFHLHDGAKDHRLHQVNLESPQLELSKIEEFIGAVLNVRGGKTVDEAFEIVKKQ